MKFICNAWSTFKAIRRLNRQFKLNFGVLRTPSDVRRLHGIRLEESFNRFRSKDGNLREEIDVYLNYGPPNFSKSGFEVPGEDPLYEVSESLIEQVEVCIRFLQQFFKPSKSKYQYHSYALKVGVEEFCQLTGKLPYASNVAMILAAKIAGFVVVPVRSGRFGWIYMTPIDPAMVRIATKGYLR